MSTRVSGITLSVLAIFLGVAGAVIAQGPVVKPADLVVIRGRVYAENPKQPWAQGVAIQGAKIVAVGDDTAIEKMHGTGTKVIDAGGKFVLPGFTDCHIHFLEGSTGRESDSKADAGRKASRVARGNEMGQRAWRHSGS